MSESIRGSGRGPLLQTDTEAMPRSKFSMAEFSWPSVRLVISYVLDWVVIVLIAGAGVGINYGVTPHHRSFSLLDLSISYPHVTEQVSIAEDAVYGLIAPAVIIAIIALVFVPGLGAMRHIHSRQEVIKTKLWELEKGLAGLALSCAASFFITQGTKNLFGKPRPNMLARCNPDLDRVNDFRVGGYGQSLSPEWVMVDYRICQNTDTSEVNDIFRSFPSGHASFAWGGLMYLTLFFMSKFHVHFPHLPFQTYDDIVPRPSARADDHQLLPLHDRASMSLDTGYKAPDQPGAGPSDSALTESRTDTTHGPFQIRHMAASPPNYLLLPAFLPIGVAVWVTSTRYVDYYHFGIDLLVGSLIGIFTSYYAFRWYHLPLSRGQGWAWGSRTKSRAFGIGVGTNGWVGEEGWYRRKRTERTV